LNDTGRHFEAEKEVRYALRLDPLDPYALGTLGDILSAEGYYDEAEEQYTKAIDNSSSLEEDSLSDTYNNLGCIYGKLDKYHEAKDCFEKAIDSNPLNIKAARNLRKISKYEMPRVEPITIQTYLLIPLISFLLIILCFFINGLYSETTFAAQSTILISLIVFAILHTEIKKVKIGGIEFERSISPKSQKIFDDRVEYSMDFERC
jgi:tetratricopeptide (TPR) repeat protein